MASLPGFNTTETWTELPGVSGVVGTFSIQNTGSYPVFVYEGAAPVDADAQELAKQGTEDPSSGYLLNTAGNQVWVRSGKVSRLVINGE